MSAFSLLLKQLTTKAFISISFKRNKKSTSSKIFLRWARVEKSSFNGVLHLQFVRFSKRHYNDFHWPSYQSKMFNLYEMVISTPEGISSTALKHSTPPSPWEKMTPKNNRELNLLSFMWFHLVMICIWDAGMICSARCLILSFSIVSNKMSFPNIGI